MADDDDDEYTVMIMDQASCGTHIMVMQATTQMQAIKRAIASVLESDGYDSNLGIKERFYVIGAKRGDYSAVLDEFMTDDPDDKSANRGYH